MFILFIILFAIPFVILVFLQQPKFGKIPSGKRLETIKKSVNYRDGAFQNKSHTPTITEGYSYWAVTKEFLFDKKIRVRPTESIPSVKTDLLSLNMNEDLLVWFGHSSYFMQVDGKKILVDPVFSGSASPIPSGTKAFDGTDIYTAEDLPEIDYLFISHDHWDHLDYKTIKQIKNKVKTVICGLGVGAHMEYWGYSKAAIIEKDWDESFSLNDHFTVHTVTARHFSGRGLQRNKSLWMAYVLQTPTMQIYIGGDSGFDTHFDQVGEKFGAFDLVILENGQYDKKWRYIHTLPDELLGIAKSLKAKKLLPVHSSKFLLSNHPWDEPLELITKNSEGKEVKVLTPMIGELVQLKNNEQTFTKWWQTIQ